MNRRSVLIILNYNTAEDTRTCLDSIERSHSSVQIIVVDNASSDRSIEGIVSDTNGAHLLQQPENVGFGRGCNAGLDWALRNTDAEFVMLLNPDTTIEPDAIGLLERCLDEHPEAGAATPKIVLMENPSFLWYGGGEICWARGSARVPGYGGDPNSGLANQAREVGFASGCAMLLRRAALERVGGFDPRYFMYEEDVELSIRLRNGGYSVRYVPRAVVKHRGQGSQRAATEPFMTMDDPRNPRLAFFVYHVVKNRLLTAAKHAQGLDKVRFCIFFPMYLVLHSLKYAASGRVDGLKAMVDGIIAFRRAVRHPFENELAGS